MADKPNIVFLITDQQRYDTVFGSECATPNLDRLAREGVSFNRAHSVNPICSPTRASIMTGKLPHNHGMVDCTHTVEPFRAQFDASAETFPGTLHDAGYSLAYYGKWHVERSGDLSKFGFDDFNVEGDPEIECPRTLVHSKKVRHKGYNDRTVSGVHSEPASETQEALLYSKGIDFIRRNADGNRPWCLFVSTNAPHDPYLAPQELYEQYDPASIPKPESFDDPLDDRPAIYRRMREVWRDLEWKDYQEIIACYYANCTLIDLQIGRLVETLRETGQLENTIVVFTSDHGDLMGAHRLLCKGIPSFEEAYRVPFILRLPESYGVSGTCDEHVSSCDIAPTLLDLAGAPPLPNADGESLRRYLPERSGKEDRFATGPRTPPPERTSYAEMYGQRFAWTQRIVWQSDYKYVFNAFDYDEFYDLKRDPHETVNRIDDVDYAGHVEELCREMWRVARETGDESFVDSEYYMFRFAPVGPERQARASVYNPDA